MPKGRRNTGSAGSRRRATSTLSLSTVALLCGLCHGQNTISASGASSNAPDTGVVEKIRSGAGTGYNEHDTRTEQIEIAIKQEAMRSADGTEALSFGGISRGLGSSEPTEACFWRWDASCQDDPTYRSKYNLRCEQHVKFDCLSFLGPFTQPEVTELIERCPCSCRVECNTFSWEPTFAPSTTPTISFSPTTSIPTHGPSARPSEMPTLHPTLSPTRMPSPEPSRKPSSQPSTKPSVTPSSTPTTTPSSSPSDSPSLSLYPTLSPTRMPSPEPSRKPSSQPSTEPSVAPSSTPTTTPSSSPSDSPSLLPSDFPTITPTHVPYACDDPKCQDNPTYISHLGLSCSAHARFDCSAMHAIGYSKEDMFLLIRSCPCSCRIRCGIWTRESSAPTLHPTLSPTRMPSPEPSRKPSDFPTITPTHVPYACDDPKCQDNPTYISHLGLSCSAHARFDCSAMHAIGYKNEDMILLIRSCPCSCRIRCGIWTREPSAVPSILPAVTFSPTASSEPIFSAPTTDLPVIPNTQATADSGSMYDCSDPTCQDDPHYKSPLSLGCGGHVQFDCGMLGMLGFTEEEVNLLLHNCPCACGVSCDTTDKRHSGSGSDVIDWTFTMHGLKEEGYGWQVSNEGRTIRFVVEPSQDCGGGKGGMQSGTATAVLVFDESRPIFYALGGLGEQLDTSYEKMELKINGELVGRSTSQAKNLECTAGPTSVKYAKNPYFVEPGAHEISILFTTGDDFDHAGVYYELTLFVDL